jgi:hypothetical protein
MPETESAAESGCGGGKEGYQGKAHCCQSNPPAAPLQFFACCYRLFCHISVLSPPVMSAPLSSVCHSFNLMFSEQF